MPADSRTNDSPPADSPPPKVLSPKVLSPEVPRWHLHAVTPPPEFVQAVQACAPAAGLRTAQLLWQRQEHADLAGYLDCDRYTPTGPDAFGPEMDQAIARLRRAIAHQESVTIWGDFDADGVTATAVLWDGLRPCFSGSPSLTYFIPNRLTDSHGLSKSGLDRLHAQGCRLVITCDTGSTNIEEIDYANQLGIDIIITDHHTLPDQRPPVVAIINPRSLPPAHPLATLSGVAVAYKLMEALYTAIPSSERTTVWPELETLLDLVAIGLIADLVELRGDCRYLAQRGIRQLQRQSKPETCTRPGVGALLDLCQRSGDRPTDISFGLGPRINAVSRIQGDAHFCVELLTSRDRALCQRLAAETELANARRKGLQNDVLKQVRDRLSQLDLSTTRVIVLADEQWPQGVLGLVAGQIAQEVGRPTILLTIVGDKAQGSARSVQGIDLYTVMKQQAHWLERFGGHPFAAGLRLAVDNLPAFTAAMNQQLRSLGDWPVPDLAIDLAVTVAELGASLFQQLKLLEPYGMGNPVPKLLLRTVQFQKVWNKNIQDRKKQKVAYIKTTFELADATATGFPGCWWGHYREEVPTGLCDAVVELDWNACDRRYEVRLIAVRPASSQSESLSYAALGPSAPTAPRLILDWRRSAETEATPPTDLQVMTHAPRRWPELQTTLWRSRPHPLALAFAPPPPVDLATRWATLIGLAKYLHRTGESAPRQQLRERLDMGDPALDIALRILKLLGFECQDIDQRVQITGADAASQAMTEPQAATALHAVSEAIADWAIALQEEHFQRQYFYDLPLATIQALDLRPDPEDLGTSNA
jgi:single-stranded-DNA-specific exonuclease